MHRQVLLALAITLMTTAPRQPAPRHGALSVPAQVRFTNHMGGNRTWSLASNGTVIIHDVLPNSTTKYAPITDTTSRLTLHREGTDSALATTNYLFVGGSYYTVTASHGNGDRPMLAVERDVPPRDTMP